MENNAGYSSELQQKVKLAKLMLLKYGALTSFHEKQLESWPLFCSNGIIFGYTEIDLDKQQVIYHLYSDREFYLNTKSEKDVVIKRKRFSIKKMFYSDKKYSKAISLAKSNLTKWTRELLWEHTKIEYIVDGKQK